MYIMGTYTIRHALISPFNWIGRKPFAILYRDGILTFATFLHLIQLIYSSVFFSHNNSLYLSFLFHFIIDFVHFIVTFFCNMLSDLKVLNLV